MTTGDPRGGSRGHATRVRKKSFQKSWGLEAIIGSFPPREKKKKKKKRS